MNRERQAEIFARRKEPAEILGLSSDRPISLGAAILLVSDPSEIWTGVRFGNGETLSASECRELRQRYKDELMLDDAAEKPED